MTNSANEESSGLSPATSGFVLSAAIAILFNTVLAWVKDAYPPTGDFMKSLSGHHWTTHGLLDLAVFVGLGFIFMRWRVTEKIDRARLIQVFNASVIIAAVGLALWYVFV